jgi:hypothetical protein
MLRRLYVITPIWTPPNFELILAAPNALAAGTEASASFPTSLLV